MSDFFDDPMSRFQAVLAVIDTNKMARLVHDMYQRLYPNDSSANLSALPTVDEPTHGSFNLVFPVTFSNGVRWVIKVPALGTQAEWNESAAQNLFTEANTMRLLTREPSIPLPDIIVFSASLQNPLGCHYMVMSFVEGIPLQKVWFGNYRGVDDVTFHLRRKRALEGIAASMVQLSRYTFPTSGRMLFDDNGNLLPGTAAYRRLDEESRLEDPSREINFLDCAASSDTTQHYTALLDKHPQHDYYLGVDRILRQLISWIPETAQDPFVLSPPDFSMHNFLVSEEGQLQAIIDWDGVAAVPRSIGNERYPGWLINDWNLEYEQAQEDPTIMHGDGDNLQYYRGLYRKLISQYGQGGTKINNVSVCRMSLVIEAIDFAIIDVENRAPILNNVVEEVWGVAGFQRPPTIHQLVAMYRKGNVHPKILEGLERGFAKLLKTCK